MYRVECLPICTTAHFLFYRKLKLYEHTNFMPPAQFIFHCNFQTDVGHLQIEIHRFNLHGLLANVCNLLTFENCNADFETFNLTC